MSKKNLQDTQQAEKAVAYWSRFSPGDEYDDIQRRLLIRLAEELDKDPDLQGVFFEKGLSLGQRIPLWFFAELSKLVQSKAVQKGIKKTLYLLKQKGVELTSPDERSQGKPAGILKTMDALQPKAYLSEFDGLRNQMVGLTFSHPVQGRILVFSLLGAEGLESFTVIEAGKSRAKEILKDLEDRSGQKFWEAEAGHVTHLLKEAHQRLSRLSREEEEDFAGILRLMEGKGAIGQAPVIRTLLDEKILETPPELDLETLIRIREVFLLLPEKTVLESYLIQVNEARSGLLILNEIQIRERLRDIVEKAVKESFPPERRGQIRRFLEETAYLRYLKGEREEAGILYYWATTFSQGTGPEDKSGHPLLVGLMETVLLTEESGEPPGDEPAEKRTRGGIILPAWAAVEEDRP